MLRIECTRCERKGRYIVANLLAQHGQRGIMSKRVVGPSRRLPETEYRSTARAVRPDLPRSAESAVVGGRLCFEKNDTTEVCIRYHAPEWSR